jgi:uncharacterized membrane protein YphA (DoxX/SURF4 family)
MSPRATKLDDRTFRRFNAKGHSMGTRNKALVWTGRVLTALIALMLVLSAAAKFMKPPEVTEQFVGKLGYPADLLPVLGIVEISCVILYVIPQTAILGAVLLTGYLGGAIATHVRIHDNFAGPAIGGVLVWLAIFLRDSRIRALLPIRRAMPPSNESSSL